MYCRVLGYTLICSQQALSIGHFKKASIIVNNDHVDLELKPKISITKNVIEFCP